MAGSGRRPARTGGHHTRPERERVCASALDKAKAYLATLEPAQFAGRDDVPLAYRIGEGMEPTLPAGQWLTVFATTNLLFHLSTAYGILRSKGVPIGKPDLFAGGL